ncbi:MAG: zf-HC2 domain-containing protein [Proteobacteria bacterium]|nr:zf-HC2 domain-containing protein [Pseudomonadota bacterium]
MSRDCNKIQNDLTAYLDGELAGKQSLFVSGHLTTCPSCRQELETLRQSLDLVLEWKEIEPSADFDRVFWKKVAAHEEQKSRKPGIFSFVWSLLTANYIATPVALALLLLITFFQSKTPQELGLQDKYMIMHADLFLNMDAIDKKEALENFEVIEVLDELEQDSVQ